MRIRVTYLPKLYQSINAAWTCKNQLKTLVTVAVVFLASQTLAAVPGVVADAQQTIGLTLNSPDGVAVAPNGTVYVADTLNGRIEQLVTNLPGPSTQSKVGVAGYQPNAPLALTVDSSGDLFISDIPVAGLGSRIVEIPAVGGNLGGTANTIYAGLLNAALSMVVYGNKLLIGDSGAIYSLGVGGGTPTLLNISGLPTGFTPAALAVDAAGDLYMANSGTGGGVYVAPATGGAAHLVLTGSFTISKPEGLAVDAAGDLFIVQDVNSSSQVIEVPNPSPTVPTSPYIIPTSGMSLSGGMAIDPNGNLDIAQIGPEVANLPVAGNGFVTQLNFTNPVYLGSAAVFGTGSGIVFNYAFNANTTLSGFQGVTIGDAGKTVSDVTEVSGGNCASGAVTGTEYAPYTCYETFAATPQYVGTRISAILAEGIAPSILNSLPVYELGTGAAEIAYPLDVNLTQLGLIEPQGAVVSGFDQTVYIADQAGGKVYSVQGVNFTALQTGSGPTALVAPIGVVMNGEGDLYIADFTTGQIVVYPTLINRPPYVLNTGGLLKHPISVALDQLGNLFVGDAGSAGDNATSSSPGYVVEVPYKGSPFVLSISVPIIFPQALAVNNITGDLLIGDGGDYTTFAGQVVKLAANGTAGVVSITSPATPTNPAGLTFDAAGNLYVLDGVLNSIIVVAPSGTSSLLSISKPSAINVGSGLASSAGQQSFVVTNLGGGTSNSLVYINGNSSTLAFGNQALHSGSAPQASTIANIGNQTLTLKAPFYSPKPIPGYPLSTSETCAGGLQLTASAPSCLFSLTFTPTSLGSDNQTVVISSNAYNVGVPLINLTGTGTPAANKVRAEEKKVEAPVVNQQARRKSFAGARRSADQ